MTFGRAAAYGLVLYHPSHCGAIWPRREPLNKQKCIKTVPVPILTRQKVEAPDRTMQVELAAIFDERKGSDGQLTHPRRAFIRGHAGFGKPSKGELTQLEPLLSIVILTALRQTDEYWTGPALVT